MASSDTGNISFSFLCLQQLKASLEKACGGASLQISQQRVIFQLVDHLREIAIPLLLRSFISSSDNGPWPRVLLVRLAKESGMKSRIYRELSTYRRTHELTAACQSRISNLIAILDVQQTAVTEQTADAGHDALAELASYMRNRADVAHVADRLIHDLTLQELLDFIEDMAAHQPGATKPLVEELILRDDLNDELRYHLQRFAMSMADIFNEIQLSVTHRHVLRHALHPDGHSSLICSTPHRGVFPPLFRAIRLDLEVNSGLVDADYRSDAEQSTIDEDLVRPLVTKGYKLHPILAENARKQASQATQVRSKRGLSMPRSYYLGRDILGLRDEHIVHWPNKSSGSVAFLAQGIELGPPPLPPPPIPLQYAPP